MRETAPVVAGRREVSVQGLIVVGLLGGGYRGDRHLYRRIACCFCLSAH